MQTLIISGDDTSQINLVRKISRQLGLKTRTLTLHQAADIHLAKKIDTAMRGKDVAREEIMKALEK